MQRAQRSPQVVTTPIGIQPKLVEHIVHGGPGRRADAKRILIGRELQNVIDAVFTLQFADRLSGLICDELANVVSDQLIPKLAHDFLTRR